MSVFSRTFISRILTRLPKQKRSLFLLSCSLLWQRTPKAQRSTPLTRLCSFSWRGSAAWRRWKSAERLACSSGWNALLLKSTTRFEEGESFSTGQLPVRNFRNEMNYVHVFGRFLMTAIAVRNLAFGLPPLDQLREEVAFANMKGPQEEANQNDPLKDEVGHAELWSCSVS